MLYMLFFTPSPQPPAKIRRLYDIANVLSSLDLIKKVHVTEERGRKPAFKWTGPEISPNNSGMYAVVVVFIYCLSFKSRGILSPPPYIAPHVGRLYVDNWKSSAR
jgi:hypothetical protein